jgi:hypothetical protein
MTTSSNDELEKFHAIVDKYNVHRPKRGIYRNTARKLLKSDLDKELQALLAERERAAREAGQLEAGWVRCYKCQNIRPKKQRVMSGDGKVTDWICTDCSDALKEGSGE